MWLLFALTASLLWGLNYVLTEKILHNLSFATLLALEMLIGSIFFSVLSYCTTFKQDIYILLTQPYIRFLLYLEIGVVILASSFIAYSIQIKNATLAGIIELIYPVFIILFTWLLFGENHINFPVIIGGILIFLGALCISLS